MNMSDPKPDQSNARDPNANTPDSDANENDLQPTTSSVPASDYAFDPADRPKEYGGRKGPDPVRYGDWEKNGRCIDF